LGRVAGSPWECDEEGSSEASHDRLMREHEADGEEEENTLPIQWKCTDQAFEELLAQRDPTGLGLPNIWAVRLVRRLLSWRPEMRYARCTCTTAVGIGKGETRGVKGG
jgi:hypothetical protein